MKRVLFVSPHYPPDGAAATHRARVMAPYLPQYGWQPTILTVDPAAYNGSLDPELGQMMSHRVDLVRAPALSVRAARRFGIGDLGLRALLGLRQAAVACVKSQRHDAVYVTTYPVYPALIGPHLKRRFRLPFVLDLQDPWVGAWGATVGGGPNGKPDLRSRMSRRVARLIEQRVVPHADGLTSVSGALLAELQLRFPIVSTRPALELPIGIDPADVVWARTHPRRNPCFDPDDGRFHVCYVGTLLPLAGDTLRAFLQAAADVLDRDHSARSKLRLHFVGTSNQAVADAEPRVIPTACELGVADVVTEHAPRLPFADALRVQLDASAILVLGSSEGRYTPSKIAPALATGRPMLVIAHEESDAVRWLERETHPSVRVVGFGVERAVADTRADIAATLSAWLTRPPISRLSTSTTLQELSGPALARRLSALFDRVTASS